MKLLLPVLALTLTLSSCIQYEVNPEVNVTVCKHLKKPPNPGSTSSLIRTIQQKNQETWEWYVQKIKDTYARVIKVLEDKEEIQFTVAFFKTLSLSENINRQLSNLYNQQNELPNTESIKHLYKTEKELNKIISIISSFKLSSNTHVQFCAAETEKYYQYQRDLLTTIRDLDYQTFATDEIPYGIPSEILRANAKFLEQQEQMATCLISFYASLAE